MNIIEAKSLFSEKELLKGINLHFKYRLRYWPYIYILGIVWLILYFTTSSSEKLYLESYLFLVLALFFFIIPVVVKWTTKRSLKKLPNLNKEIFWSLTEKELSGKGEGFEFKQDWVTMYDAIITSQGLLIYPQEHMFYWLPRSAFKNSDFEKTIVIVTGGIKKVKNYIKR